MFSLMNLYLLKKQDCIILILYENIVNKNKCLLKKEKEKINKK